MKRAQAKTDVLRSIENSIAVKQALLQNRDFLAMLKTVGMSMVDALQEGHKFFFMGNGGSAADAQHLAAEFVGRYLRERKPLPAIALSVNTSSLTAIANDYSYEMVFARQLQALAAEGDVAIGLSTSGNSRNILCAMEAAKAKHMITVGLSGETGGQLRERVDYCFCAPSRETPRIQEAHIMIGHLLCEIVEDELFG
jgi:D-sedoheptulose 7-phosphate isomerase